MKLRPAEPADIAFIMACERRPGYADYVGQWPEARHRSVMADPAFRYLIAQDDGAPTGFAILHTPVMRPKNLYLKRIAVHDAERGAGQRFLAALHDWVFSETETHRLWLEVVVENARARHVYLKMGWREEGIVREGYSRDDGSHGDFIQMSILRHEWDAV